MKIASLDYYKERITDIEIAQEIIETSEMDEKTRQTFKVFLEEVKKSDEDWGILRERLAGWLCKANRRNPRLLPSLSSKQDEGSHLQTESVAQVDH